MLQPKRTKFRKAQKGRMKGLSQRGSQLSNGMFGVKSTDSHFVTSRQIEAVRRVITRKLKRTGQLWIRVFPHIPVTKKPVEVRMGKGKGPVDRWVAVVKPGTIIYEVGEAKENLAKVALLSGAKKLSMKCNFVKRS